MIDVSAYLNRINYRGSTKPTLETLRGIHRAHLLTIPFENLDIHRNRQIVLNEAALFEKIIVNRRGGYCYELNGLLASLLRAMGFDITMFSSNVIHGGIPAEIDHLTLLIQLDDRYIVDVGFGDSSRLPLRLVGDEKQSGVDSSYRFARSEDRWLLQRLLEADEWYDEYSFNANMTPLTLSDFENANRYYQTAPESYFVQGRICSRAIEDGRISLTGDTLIVTRNGQREETPIDSEQAFVRALNEISGFESKSNIRRHSMNINSIWSALEESMNILGDDHGYPAMFKRAEELAPESNWLTWVPAVLMFASDTFTVAEFMRIFPYGLARLNKERLAIGVQSGYLTTDDEDGYCATESGKNVTRLVTEAFDQAIASVRFLSDESFQPLVGYLYKLVEATFATAKPTASFLFSGKRNMRPLRMDGVPHQLEQYISELAGYRDDMYVAAWQAHKIEGHTWEVLDRLSQSDALTLDELHEKTSGRGVTREVHTGDVRELVRRGWVEEGSGVIQITSEGKRVRAEVEAETERLFFAPWSCLNEFELEELASLAGQLRDGLRASVKQD